MEVAVTVMATEEITRWDKCLRVRADQPKEIPVEVTVGKIMENFKSQP
jgi:hypothetical protein